jgi:probable rRNA maturation factor
MISIDLVSKSKKWLAEKNIEKFIKKTCEELILLTDLKKILRKNFQLEVAISLVSDLQIKKMNQQFRSKSAATNVLSFPALDENLLRQIGLKKLVGGAEYLFLGDIVIAYETTKKEALLQKKDFHHHLTHLILHSILHLLGHDHEESNMAEKMENLEIKILKKLKIKNPYQPAK